MGFSTLQIPVQSSNGGISFPAICAKSRSGIDTFKGLPGLLADMLPDRYGSELFINLWLAQQGVPRIA